MLREILFISSVHRMAYAVTLLFPAILLFLWILRDVLLVSHDRVRRDNLSSNQEKTVNILYFRIASLCKEREDDALAPR